MWQVANARGSTYNSLAFDVLGVASCEAGSVVLVICGGHDYNEVFFLSISIGLVSKSGFLELS
jgi:hypothetical protein